MAIEHDKYGRPVMRQARQGLGQGLSLAPAPRKSDTPNAGSDPYNTSGSFDRKKNWARVGKR